MSKQYSSVWRNLLNDMARQEASVSKVGDRHFLSASRVDPRAVRALEKRGYVRWLPDAGAYILTGEGVGYAARNGKRKAYGTAKRTNGSSVPAQGASAPAERYDGHAGMTAALTALTGAINAQNRRLDMVAARLGMVLDAINGHGNATETWLESAVNETVAQQILTRRTNELLARLVAAWEGQG